jgi:hypothetical protein
MKYSEFNYVKELLQNEVPRPNKIKLILDRLMLFMADLTDLLFS